MGAWREYNAIMGNNFTTKRNYWERKIMDFPRFFRRTGRILLELITIGLIGVLVFVFLMSMWETKYLLRYKYTQGQDIAKEILDSKFLKTKVKEPKPVHPAIMHPVVRLGAAAVKLFKWETDKAVARKQITYVNLEVDTDSLIKLKEKAKEKDLDMEIYINNVLKEHVKK